MPFFTNRKNIEQKVCSKRTIQGGIEKFVTNQTTNNLLSSKNKPKQERLDRFLKRKSDNFNLDQTSTKKKHFFMTDDTIAKKQKTNEINHSKKGLKVDESILIESDSSSDEYHTAPCTQDESKSKLLTEKENNIFLQDNQLSAISQLDSSNLHVEQKKEILDVNSLKKNDASEKLLEFNENKNVNSLVYVKIASDDSLNSKMLNETFHDESEINSQQSLCDDVETFILPNKYFVSDLKSLRFKVMAVLNNDHNKKCFIARHEKHQKDVLFQLTDEWENTYIDPDDNINVIADDDIHWSGEKQLIHVGHKQNLLVLHPNLLISGTTVSNGLGCLRRAVLSERFKNTDFVDSKDVSSIMLVGTIVHSLFQQAIKDKTLHNKSCLSNLARDIVFDSCHIPDIVSVNSTQEKVLKEIMEYVPQVENWIAHFCDSNKSANSGKVNMKYKKNNEEKFQRYSANVALTQVLDIEENVWSPRYGLKGKIDVTGRFKVKNQQTKEEIETIMPVEIKTGKDTHSMEHHVQVAIYSMFCDERRNQIKPDENSIGAGLLVYLKTNSTACESLSRSDQCGILSLRNQIAHYLAKTVCTKKDFHSQVAPFPPTTTNTRICEMCSQLKNCSLVYKSVDEPQSSFSPSSHLLSMMIQHLSHLNQNDLTYFEHWMTCVFLEAKEAALKDKQSKFWEKGPIERSKRSHLSNGIFEKNEMILISGDEPKYIAMATGIVKEIGNEFITVETERDFTHYPRGMLYSIDRHVWGSNISVQSSLSNLSMIMNDDSQCNKLRNLIIHHKEPSFRSSLDFIPRSSKDQVAAMLRGLNRTQRQAIKRVLLSNDYTLVVGMPGSGKTTTIVAMIRILLLCNLRVLVTSYTHSAVDNLLLKLVRYKVKFLRLGKSSVVHPSIKPFTDQHLSRDFKEPDQLRNLFKEARVVGCTCLAVTSHLFFSIPGQSRPLFDVCIVDEASQISQPVCLSPLMYAARFVLVGDHQQLPPLVVSQEAKDMGADESLFWRLTRHESALCELTLQYRMNSEIMELSNHMTYQGRLECAHSSVAEAKLQLLSWSQVEGDIPSTDWWLARTLRPNTSLVFLDTSEVVSVEEIEVENQLEAKIIARITKFLIKSGCSPNNIGIIAPFRKQVQLLENILLQLTSSGVEVNTVDKYQGRDKSVILLSFVKSKESDQIEKKGELLSDWRRLNVAITRAKHKLVMVGCIPALQQYQPCKKLLDYLRRNDLIVSLRTGG